MMTRTFLILALLLSPVAAQAVDLGSGCNSFFAQYKAKKGFRHGAFAATGGKAYACGYALGPSIAKAKANALGTCSRNAALYGAKSSCRIVSSY